MPTGKPGSEPRRKKPPADQDAANLQSAIARQQQRPAAGNKTAAVRGLQPIGQVVAELLGRKGYAQLQTAAEFAAAWKRAAGKLSGHSRVGQLRGGVLEVIAGSSLVVQELRFRKKELLASLAEQIPGEAVRDLRFKVGAIA